MVHLLVVCVFFGVAVVSAGTSPVRILGGEDSIQDVPYQAAVMMFKENNFHCGAVIISETVVATAAHCILRQSIARMYMVRVGSDRWSEGGQLLNVKSLYVHDNYVGGPTYENDIALLPLTSEIIFDGLTVAPIPLVQSGEVTAAGIRGLVSGWGSGVNEQVEDLQIAHLTVVDNGQCAQMYVESGIHITKKMLCARVNPITTTCGPDAGGPFVVEGVLVGIVAVSKECGNPLYPAVFTDIASMNGWIADGLVWASQQD